MIADGAAQGTTRGVGEPREPLRTAPRDGETAVQICGDVRRQAERRAARPIAARMPKGVRKTLGRDQNVAVTGQSERQLYAVRSGILATSLVMDEGDAYVSALHYPGDLVPVAWLETEWPVAVRAVTDAEVEVYSEGALHRFFAEDPEGAFDLFDKVCDLAVRQREDHCLQRRRSVEARLADFLLTLGDHLGVRDGRRFRIALPMRRCEIANYLGLRSETLSRVFARWRGDGLIEAGELRQITFADIGRLEAMSRDET